jgi:hypothetical protein
MFIRGMAETVKAKIKHFGRDNIKPGDIYVTSDSYLTVGVDAGVGPGESSKFKIVKLMFPRTAGAYAGPEP